ncbi:MAG: Calx-beta domain-containing protein [Lysobacteraceae bacterium]
MRSTCLGGLVLALGALWASPASAELVISQIYGGGGNANAVYTHDFVELFNAGDAPATLDGLSLQYGSATGNFGSNDALITALPAQTLLPGQYFLIQLARGNNDFLDLPDPDLTGDTNAAAANGKFALVTGTGALGCSNTCSPAQLARIVDLVGYGTANAFAGASAAPAAANDTAVVRADAGCRNTPDNGLDFFIATPAPRNSASTRNPCSGDPDNPQLSVNSVSLPEGDEGITVFDFTVTLFPAIGTDVSFDIATADGTAVAGVDYAARSETDVVIPAGETVWTFSVDVLGNTIPEPDKTFFVNLSNAQGATITVAQGTGTIENDDFALTPISAIHGEQIGSPLLGEPVVVEGIVTARRNNGFFVQTPDGQGDGNPATSEGLFIFTGNNNVPAEAANGNRVRVQGTVAEFLPAGTPDQLPLVQLTGPVTTLLETGLALPAPVQLTLADLDPGNDIAYLERYIGMRVAAPDLQVIAPSLGSTNTNTGTASNNGVFQATHVDLPRPFREPGIGVLELTPFPDGVEPPVFDTNPERLRVQSNAQPGAESLQVSVGDRVEGIVGVLDYGFRTYTLLPDPGTATVIEQAQVRNIEPAGSHEIAVGTYNLFNLPASPNAQRLLKTSRAICEGMGAPAIVALQESFGPGAISALADAINQNLPGSCPAGADYRFIAPPNPNGSIQLALLYDVGLNAAGLPRAQLESFELVGVADRVDNPDGSQSVLNDRPPLVAEMTASTDSGETVGLTVINVHQRSLIGVNSLAAGPSGWPTEGERVRDKRLRSALWLAGYLEQRQSDDPERPVLVLGDFNAFEFSDGFVDVLGILTGFPAAADEVLLHAGSPVQVPLLNLVLTVPEDDRYSFVFDGSAQVLDHILANAATLERFEDVRMAYARINADFAIALFGDGESPARASDHDPAVAFLRVAEAPPMVADARLTGTTMRGRPGVTGTVIPMSAELTNIGPDGLVDPVVRLALAGTTDPISAEGPEGWTCDAPVVDGDGQAVECRLDGLLPTGQRAGFTLLWDSQPSPSAVPVTFSGSVDALSQDPNPGNNSFQTRTTALPARP